VNEDTVKLTSYFGERQRAGGRFAADALLDLYGQEQVAASILLRGVAGFGAARRPSTDGSLTLSEDLPLTAVAVDQRARIEPLAEQAARLCGGGLVTLERARLLSGDISPVTLPEDLHEETKLTLYLGRQERVGRTPGYIAVCELLHARGVAGATALLGVDGTAHGERHRAEFFGRNTDVPTTVMAIGTGQTIARVLPELGALIRTPLISVERVRICKRDGEVVERPHALPGTDEHGMAMWQKLTVFASEAAHYRGQPIHRALTRRLRTTGASGVTTLRGIWGYHGDHAPHGDRPLRVVRHVPTLTIAIDTPERVAEIFPIVDEITRDRGLVTVEMVPALRARAERHERGGLGLARHRF
jgi:PII-like signaling protein